MRTGLIKCVLAVAARMPLAIDHAIGAALGFAVYWLPTRLTRTTHANLALCYPELQPRARRRLARLSLMATGQSFTEAGHLWAASRARIVQLVKRTTGEDVVDAALAHGRGMILATPHLGAWELCGLYAGARWPLVALYEPPKLAGLEGLIRAGREHTGARLVPTDLRGIRALLTALRRGECIGVLPDQVPRHGQAAFAPFFARPAYTMLLLARLSEPGHTPVVFMYAERLARGRGYHVHFRAPAQAMDISCPEAAARATNAGVEALVRERPEQYAWSYKRFKRRPPGEPSPYRRKPRRG